MLFWLLTDLLLLMHNGKQMHFFYKKIKPGEFSQSLFWSSAEKKIIVCFSGCPRLCVDLSSSGVRPWNRELMKRAGRIKEICRSWVSGSVLLLVDQHSRWILCFQSKRGCIVPCRSTASLSVTYMYVRKNNIRFMEDLNLKHVYKNPQASVRILWDCCLFGLSSQGHRTRALAVLIKSHV